MDKAFFMARALRLAERGIGKVSPNPAVGCVLVRDGKIVSEGYHERYGGPHAEINAISRVDPAILPECILFVTLEPCSHHGKTPPCTDAIIRSGIRSVVIGSADPNPLVNGRGIRRLTAAGANVSVGILEAECRRLNEPFFHFMNCNRPFVTLKAAQTLDGRVAASDGQSRWISGPGSRRIVHHLRAGHDAIVVGVETVIRDDPELTVRDRSGKRVRGPSPLRIVLDPRLRIPESSRLTRLSDPERTIVITGFGTSETKRLRLERAGVRVWQLRIGRDRRFRIRSLLDRLAREGVLSVMVEGGPGTWTAFLRSRLADRVIVFVSPRLMGDGLSVFGGLGARGMGGLIRFEKVSWRRSGEDMLFIGERPCSPVSSRK
jgi:diaminohydroxyphosphoribosylaminopyrimidine deaminase / 5-amino-6-(5-phosphoribosylamino)uracil reductase